MKPQPNTHEIAYNNDYVGKVYKSLKEARIEMKRLRSLNLWGYTIREYKGRPKYANQD